MLRSSEDVQGPQQRLQTVSPVVLYVKGGTGVGSLTINSDILESQGSSGFLQGVYRGSTGGLQGVYRRFTGGLEGLYRRVYMGSAGGPSGAAHRAEGMLQSMSQS